VTLGMFFLEQPAPVPTSASGGVSGLNEENGFDIPLEPIVCQFVQHQGGIRMGPIIEGEEKSVPHKAFCFSVAVFTTLPVQT
jgi:hypothetical protein